MSEEGFLSRWSRRKRAAEAGRPEEPPAPPPVSAPVAAAVPPPPEAAEPPAAAAPPFDPASLPSLDALTAGSDITAFLRQEVPEALRRAALRKAWTLDPAIRDFVGLADYDWDYNAPAGVPGFALDLGGDAKEMLAQLFGPGGATPEAAAPEEARAAAEAVTPPPAATDPPAAEEVPAVPAAPSAIAVAATTDAAAPAPVPAPRRHGSAVPS